jgi:hypothetical protein
MHNTDAKVFSYSNPPPSVKIVDISPDNTNTTKAAGQSVILSAQPVPSSATITSVSWTIPGSIAASYVRTLSSGAESLVVDKTANPIQFYWIGPVASQPVSVSAVVNQVPVSASVIYIAEMPTIASPSAVYGPRVVAAFPPPTPPATVNDDVDVQYASWPTPGPANPNPTAIPAIKIQANLSAPAHESGYFNATQLVNANFFLQPGAVYLTDVNGVQWSPSSGTRLDTCTLYNPTQTVGSGSQVAFSLIDAPSWGFDKFNYTNLNSSGAFSTYIMFRPAGTQSI